MTMGNLLVKLEDATGTRRVVTADGADYADDMRLLNVMRVKAELHGWTIVGVKRNGRNFKPKEDR